MTESRSIPKIFLYAGLGVVLLGLIAVIVIQQAKESRSELPVHGTVPEFEFVNQDGEAFGKKNLRGKITILDFIFTNCPGPCPIMSSKMAILYEKYAGSAEVQFVSISVDPERDSLEALKAYGQRYGVTDNRWTFLRAPIGKVRDLSVNGFMLGGDFPMGHSTRFVLIDQAANIRGYYRSMEDASLDVLQTDIKVLAG